jgi:hypothetical protein
MFLRSVHWVSTALYRILHSAGIDRNFLMYLLLTCFPYNVYRTWQLYRILNSYSCVTTFIPEFLVSSPVSSCILKFYGSKCYIPNSSFPSITLSIWESGCLSRYSDWLRATQMSGRSSSPGKGKNFLFSTSSRPVLGPTQPPIQWIPGALSPGGKAAGSRSWKLTSN